MEFNSVYKNNCLGETKHTLPLLEQRLEQVVVPCEVKYARSEEPVKYEDKDNYEYKDIKVGQSWGNLFDCAWFKVSCVIPEKYRNHKLYIKFDISGEALLYNSKGTPIKGFTNGSSVFKRSLGEPGKKYYEINEFIDSTGVLKLDFDGACNDLFGKYQDNGKIINAEVITKDDELLKLYYDFETCLFLMSILNKGSKKYEMIFDDLYDIHKLILYEEEDYINKSLKLIKKYINKKTKKQNTVYALGHAHIDLAWLWPIRETKRKLLRTLTNVFYMFEKYPEFTFGISQPQLLEWLEEKSPETFDKLMYYYKAGRLELQGGAWVEMDTNLTGEEAIVRQFLYGMNYYKEKFNFRPNSLWLPDVFGYSGNLPQIIKKSGLDNFMTIKLSWNLINRFPYHTFHFEGIDGSRVLAHMPPEGNYNSSASAVAFDTIVNTYREKDISDETLLLYGIGDGGGGPGDEHMERINRNIKIEEMPNIKLASSEEFFNVLNKKQDNFPVYIGELYLENHQGTFTSQSNIKKYNRHMENKIKTVEYLMTYFNNISVLDKLDEIWKEVLLYQFHDILPGSSIKRVYDEALKRYEILDHELTQLCNEVTNDNCVDDLFIASHIFNPNKDDVMLYIKNDNLYRKIRIEALTSNKINDDVNEILPIELNNTIETNSLKVEIDLDSGKIIGCFDKIKNHELIGEKYGNNLVVYKDVGDAWNINYEYRFQTPNELNLVKKELTESLDFFEYNFIYQFKESTVCETVRIYKNQQLIEFYHDVDWQNIGYMLRSSFDLNIKADEAISDIQFGEISRSRLIDTSIRKAQIEVTAQNWISVYDGKYGAALLNSSKYGYYIKGTLLDINLLRSTNYPCENGDIGKTSYQYSLFIHDGDTNIVDIKAKELNAVYQGFSKNLITSKLFELEKQNIHYSSLKPAYNKEGDILRLYNNSNQDTSSKIRFVKNEFELIETNMIEEEIKSLGISDVFELSFTPFEVKTFRLIEKI